MVFWLSVIVFIAGLMTYMFFPRNDQYQQDIYQQEGNIVSFVNQHQAAKDLMYQMIQWNSGEAGAATPAGIYVFPYSELSERMPTDMRQPDIYHVEDNGIYISQLNPINPSAQNGYYTSAVVCLTSCVEGDDGCVHNKKMAACPSDEQYVITYGRMPDYWWRNKDSHKWAWFKAMLKRTHGAIGCGLLDHRGDGFYSLDNSQKHIGYQTINNQQVIPPALINKFNNLGITTCNPGEECTNRQQDLLFCMTPFQNPYLGTPLFWWDSINNTGRGHTTNSTTGEPTTERGIPLIGTLDNNIIDGWTSRNSYSLAGAVTPATNAGSGNKQILNLGNNVNLVENCADSRCTLAVRDNSTTYINVQNIPQDRPYAFLYVATPNNQKLTVYYNAVESSKLVWRTQQNSNNNAAPALSAPAFADTIGVYPYLVGLRIYTRSPTAREIGQNVKADRKRYGL